MTVPASQENRFSYAGNGVTTAFAYSAKFLANADLVVVSVNNTTGAETVKTLTTDYTVAGAGTSAGTVTMLAAPASGTTLVIYGDPVLSQLVDPVNGDNLDVDAVIEAPLDKLTIIARRVKDLVTRALRLSDGVTSSIDTEISTTGKAGYYLRLNAAGNAFELAEGDANDSTFTQSGTGAVERSVTSKLAESVSVEDFGAVGDGTTDDTTAIQAAITALGNSGGTLLFPPGTYKTTAKLTLSRNVTLQGVARINAPTSLPDGNACAVIKATIADDILYYDYGGTAVDANIGVYDIVLDGNSIATNGVYFGKHRGVRFQRLVVKGCVTNGIYLDDPSAGNSYTSDMEDVYVNMPDSTTTACFRIATAWAKLTRCVTDGAGYSLHLSGSKGSVTQCHFEGAGTAGIELASSKNKIFGNNIVMTATANSNQIGIRVPNTSGNANNSIFGNTIIGVDGTTSYGMHFVGTAAGVSATVGNDISGFDKGIVDAGNFNTHTGNVIDVRDEGIAVSGSNCSITGGLIAVTSGHAVNNSGGSNSVRGVSTSNTYNGITPMDERRGTWTPVIAGNSTPGTQTYSQQNGYYTKVGRLVHIQGTATMTAKDGATAGSIKITGLPFTSAAGANRFSSISLNEFKVSTFTNKMLVGKVAVSSTEMFIMDNGATAAFLDAAAIGNDSYFIFSGTYETNES